VIWKVVAEAGGAVVHSDFMTTDKRLTLAAGAYRLEVSPYSERTGAYSLKVVPG
jgi:hypothetical protein